MSAIFQAICYSKSVRIGDYVQYNEDRFGYFIEIIDDINVQIRGTTDSLRTTMDEIKSNTICVVPLTGGKPSVDQNIRHPSSSPEDKNNI